ncbi:Uncharacterised protein [Bordetella pertussis]|nr:Uncharacterised protein [Bordetella pertussis]
MVKTLSPKWDSSWADTCCCKVMRGSNITRNKPMTRSSLLILRCTRLIVFTRSDRPSSAKYSHCIGMMTPCAAASPLRVSSDSVGGQSISTKSYSPAILSMAALSWRSRSSICTRSISAPDSSRLAGNTS